MIDTLIIICYLTISIHTAESFQHEKTCAFARFKTELEAASRQAVAETNSHFQKEIDAQIKSIDFGKIHPIRIDLEKIRSKKVKNKRRRNSSIQKIISPSLSVHKSRNQKQ